MAKLKVLPSCFNEEKSNLRTHLDVCGSSGVSRPFISPELRPLIQDFGFILYSLTFI